MNYHNINSVRVGNISRVSPLVIEHTLGVLCYDGDGDEITDATKNKVNELNTRLKSTLNVSESKEISATERFIQSIVQQKPSKQTREEMFTVLSNADVVFSTLNAAGSAPLLGRTFDVVIIDEAAQAIKPDCWVALMKAKKAILAGDHLQLPPTVKTYVAEDKLVKAKGMSTDSDLSYTLFTRLIDMYDEDIKRMLSVQYRMNKKIMQFSAEQIYENKLYAHHGVSDHLFSDLPNFISSENTNVPLILIDTSDTSLSHEIKDMDNREETSTANELEAAIVARHIEILINESDLRENQIGVITPYVAQVVRLCQQISERRVNTEIDSVDGFQGREKEAIIMSLVRSNSREEVGFVAEKRRLNVAMTRAKTINCYRRY